MNRFDVLMLIVGWAIAFWWGLMAGRRDTRHQVSISIEPLRCPKCGEKMVSNNDLVASIEGLKHRGTITAKQADAAHLWIAKTGGAG